MGLFIGNNFPLKLDKLNPEIENLQMKCNGKADIREANLLNLRSILAANDGSTNRVERKFMQVDSYAKNLERALIAALPFQGLFSPTSVKALSEMFTRLFSLLSAEMCKLDEEAEQKIGKKKLEKVEKKIAREKRFKPKIENSEKSKQSG